LATAGWQWSFELVVGRTRKQSGRVVVMPRYSLVDPKAVTGIHGGSRGFSELPVIDGSAEFDLNRMTGAMENGQ
jgi:hypothetical protein